MEEDEDAIEVVIEEEEVQKAGQWTILARFYSLKSPNLAALFEDMRRAWRLRSDMTYKSLRDNLFIISFGAEGDYRFVIQGGPWIHRGDALLVAEFDGITCLSKVTLDVIPVWVRIYDLPLVLMTKARGEIYGSKLGRVQEVDVGDDGRNKHDFFRIRVDLSVKRPLKDKLTIKISAQGRVETRSFALRYERVPHFCFICGFMGHADKDCDKRGANVENPFRFSADLRCSPLKPFERKVNKVRAMQNTGAARNLFFRGAGSAGSSSSKQRDVEQWDEAIPPRVDAHDNFDDKEKEGDSSVDEQLALQANLMNMAGTEGIDKEHDDSQGPKLKSGSNVVALAGSAGEAIPSKEMIPAIANLQQQASFGDGSSDDWSGGNRKRTQDTTEINKPGRVQIR